ncbi:MAG: hypothetical protein ACI90G_002129 [Urechidicola sp.]
MTERLQLPYLTVLQKKCALFALFSNKISDVSNDPHSDPRILDIALYRFDVRALVAEPRLVAQQGLRNRAQNQAITSSISAATALPASAKPATTGAGIHSLTARVKAGRACMVANQRCNSGRDSIS